MSGSGNIQSDPGPRRIISRDIVMTDRAIALKLFDEWWYAQGKCETQSLMVVSENMLLRDKVGNIFIEGVLHGLAELKPTPKPIQTEHGAICPTCDRLIDASLIPE